MSANQKILESQVRHQVYLQRRGAHIANEIVPIIERVIREVAGRVANTDNQASRQKAILAELSSILGAAYGEVDDRIIQHALELAAYEADFQVKMIGAGVTVALATPAIEQIEAVALTDPMDLQPGRQMTVRDALREFKTKKQRQITQTIQDGIVQQQTSQEIAQQLRSVSTIQKRQADTLVRTVTNGVGDSTRRLVYRENADIIEKERWVSTLDGRTSAVCQARDGDEYPVGEGPRPPAHYNCRSLRVPVVRKDLQIPGLEGERPAVGADGTGTVSSRMTYTGFLRSQPAEFQDDVLGQTRAKMFRSGEITLDDLVNDFGEPLTLDQIRQREGL